MEWVTVANVTIPDSAIDYNLYDTTTCTMTDAVVDQCNLRVPIDDRPALVPVERSAEIKFRDDFFIFRGQSLVWCVLEVVIIRWRGQQQKNF